MGKFFLKIIRFKYFIISIIIILTLLSIIPLTKIEIDTTFDRLASSESIEKKLHQRTVKEFGSQRIALIYIKDKKLFTTEKLSLLQELSWQLLEIEELETLYSVFTTPFVHNNGEILNTSPLFEEIPNSKSEINKKISFVNNDRSYKKFILSPDDNSMIISIQFNSNKRSFLEIGNHIDKLLKPLKHNFEKIHTVGAPSLMKFSHENILKSLKIILPIIIIVISTFIFIGTRSLNAAVLPFIVGFISIIWTFAIMSFLGIPIQVLTSCVPAIAFVLGSTEITHLLSKYRQLKLKGLSHIDSIEQLGSQIGLAIILTAATTIFGFSTIIINEIQMLKEFGYASAIALSSNFILMLFYLPIHLDIFKETDKKPRPNKYLEKIKILFLEFFEYLLSNKLIYLILIFLISISIFFSKKIEIENLAWSQIKNGSLLKTQLKEVDSKFPGTSLLYFVVESRSGTFKQNKNLKYLDSVQNKVNKLHNVQHTQSLANNIKLIHKEFNKDSILLSKIPESDNLIAQYLLSFSRDNLSPYISADYKRALIQVRHSNYDTKNYNKLVKDLESLLSEQMNNKEYKLFFTSSDQIFNKATNSLITSQIKSLFLIVIIIILAVAFLFRDFKIALIAVPSNLIPIVLFFGILGLFNIPLTIGSSMVAAITIGIAIDDTIHFFVQYSNNLNRFPNPIDSAKNTINESSTAIITTSIALSTGFFFMAMSEFVPLYQFGILSAIVILLAMFCDLIITPTLITVFKLSNIVSYDNVFLTQIPITKIIANEYLKGIELKTLKKLMRQVGFSYINEKQYIDIDKKSAFIIIIKGTVAEKIPSNRATDCEENIELKRYESGDIIKITVDSKSRYQAFEQTRYIHIKENKFAQFMTSKK